MRSKSSKQWLQEHFADPYVKQAQQQGYRSRAAYKLLEIQEKEKLIKSGMVVLDLGAAPGGWAEIVAKLVGKEGRAVALDILPLDPIAGVEFIQGDFTDEETLQRLRQLLAGNSVDVVLSDMAPNLSGIKVSDQARTIYLAELALDCALQLLKENGAFLVKVFQGAEFDALLKQIRAHFKQIKICKPKASRPRSKELYILAKGFIISSVPLERNGH